MVGKMHKIIKQLLNAIYMKSDFHMSENCDLLPCIKMKIVMP